MGQVPEHWGILALRRVLIEPLSNGLFKKREYWGTGVKIVNVFDAYVKSDVVDETSLDRVICDDSEIEKYLVQHGDFVFVRSSLKLEGIGKVASILKPSEEIIFECHLVRGRPDTKKVDPKFLCYFLNSSYSRQLLISSSNQVTMATIDQEKIKSLVIAIPKISEQITIARFLDYKTAQIDALIANKELLLKKLAQKRTAIISHAVTKGLDPSAPMKDSGVPWLGEIPNNWDSKRIKFVVSYIGSGKTPRGGTEVYISEGIMLLRSQNIYDDGLRLDDAVFITDEADMQQSSSRVKPFDVLLNITGASIGRTSIVPEIFHNANVNQHVCIMRPNKRLINPEYLHLLMCSQQAKDQIIAQENGTSREGLNFYQVGNLIFAFPSITNQNQIILYIKNSTARLDAMKNKVIMAIKKLKEYRISLITHAVTGKIDVRGFKQYPNQ